MKKLRMFFRLPTFVAEIIIAIMAVIMLIISFIISNDCQWYSNVMISASCGIITGLVLFFLTNLRANTYNRVKREYELLLKARNDSHDIIRDSKYYMKCRCLWNEDIEVDNFFKKIFERTEAVQSILFDQISCELYRESGFEENNPIDYGTIDNLWNKYAEAEDNEEIIDELLSQNIDNLNTLISMLKEPIQKRKTKLLTYERYYI